MLDENVNQDVIFLILPLMVALIEENDETFFMLPLIDEMMVIHDDVFLMLPLMVVEKETQDERFFMLPLMVELIVI
jgi:hypothetical protein